MAFIDASSPTAQLSVVNLGSLAVLRPLLDKIGIVGIIDRHIPTDAEISHGTVLAILLAARLHSPVALVNVAQWAREHGVEYLWNVDPDKLNDDRLARALDAFFPKRHDILADVTHAVLRLTRLDLACCHFDATHLVLYGAYEASQPRPTSLVPPKLTRRDGTPDADAVGQLLSDIRMSPAHITRGYLTRYKMLQLGLTSVVDELGAVPVACHPFDGNRNGHTGVKQQYQLLRHFLRLPEDLLLVSDRGTCSAEHLATLLRHQHYALCAGQWQDYGPLFEEHAEQLQWAQASYLSLEQQRRRSSNSTLPREEYRLAVIAHELIDPVTKQPVPCRVIFVHASAAAKECQKRREKNIALIKAGLDAIAGKLVRAHPTTTPQSVSRQIVRLLGNKDAAQYFSWQLAPLTEAEQAALPSPRKGFRRQTHRLEYRFDADAAQAGSRHDGIYALITTAPASWSADALFTQYKRQSHVEREHHELKTPLAVTPLFLKTPERIEALVHLLFLALQANMTLERLYRQRVPSTAPLAERHMTAEKILKQFNVCGVTVQACEFGDLVRVAQLSPEQRRILNHLSLPTPATILQRTLNPPPTP